MKQIELYLILLTSLFTIIFSDTTEMGEACMYTYMLILTFDVIRRRSFTVLHVWLAGFIFMICSEIVLVPQYSRTWSSVYVINANSIFLFGYFLSQKRKVDPMCRQLNSYSIGQKNMKAELLIYTMAIVYMYFFTLKAVSALLFGRIVDPNEQIQDSQFLYDQIFGSIGLVLPAIASFYYRVYKKRHKWMPWVISVPVFLLLFMMGTRNTLLFSLLGFVIAGRIVDITHLTKKNVAIMAFFSAVLLSSTLYMKEFRSGGLDDSVEIERSESSSMSLAAKMAQYMSIEGVVTQMNNAHDYFENNPHTYGLSTGFVFYFWIPRAVWHDKPTMLGHWLVRKSDKVSEAHSVSYGFAGEPYADFGYLSLLLVFFFGVMLKKIEIYQMNAFLQRSHKSIMAAMIFPFVFFFVRSPVTSTMTLIGSFVWFLLFTHFIKQHKDKKRNKHEITLSYKHSSAISDQEIQ